jgi:hypothetical protein
VISTCLTRFDLGVLAAAVVISAGLAVQPTSAKVLADGPATVEPGPLGPVTLPAPSRPAPAHTSTALKLALYIHDHVLRP